MHEYNCFENNIFVAEDPAIKPKPAGTIYSWRAAEKIISKLEEQISRKFNLPLQFTSTTLVCFDITTRLLSKEKIQCLHRENMKNCFKYLDALTEAVISHAGFYPLDHTILRQADFPTDATQANRVLQQIAEKAQPVDHLSLAMCEILERIATVSFK